VKADLKVALSLDCGTKQWTANVSLQHQRLQSS